MESNQLMHQMQLESISRSQVIEDNHDIVKPEMTQKTQPQRSLTPIPETRRPRPNYRQVQTMEDQLFTQNQAVLYVVINFAVATILLIAVNTNTAAQCAPIIKQWLILLALILSTGSLLQVIGIDIRYKPIVQQQAFEFCKVLQFVASVSWVAYGYTVYFKNGKQCQQSAPVITYTMMFMLVLGTFQLVMVAILVGGTLYWLFCRMTGRACPFTPLTLWRDQQNLIDQDPQVQLTRENKQILKNLRPLHYEDYRRQNLADRIYGVQEGQADYWQEKSQEDQIQPQCAICMEVFTTEDHVSPMPCHVNHLFHTDCLKPWLEKNKNCPLCKYTVKSPRELSMTQDLMLNTSIASRSHSFNSQEFKRRPQSKYF